MPVRIEIIATCAISAADLDFGSYNTAAATSTLGETTVQLHCSAGTIVEVALDGGTTGSNTSQRKLTSASSQDRLAYDLYQDSARTVHWGDRPGTDTREMLATGAPQAVPVYGKIHAGQKAAAGTYSDVITVQVQF